jgi:hypothetical protein
MGPNVRALPGVLCKRRGILYFAGEPDRIIGPGKLRDGNVRVPIWLRRRLFYGLADPRSSGQAAGVRRPESNLFVQLY